MTKIEKKQAHQPTEILSFLNLKQDHAKEQQPTKEQSFQIWDSTKYFEQALDNPQTIKTQLSPDLITLWHEYSAYLSEKKYDQESRFGLNGEYGVLVSQICRNFENALRARGKDTHRAALETWVAQSYEHFKTNDSYPIGSLLISISPRGGSEKDGLDECYPGLDPKNYVFINVFVKTAANRILPRQFMSYAPTADLKQLQQSLLENPFLLSPREYTQVPLPQSFHSQKAKTLPTRNEHEVIGKLIAIPCTEQDTDSQLQIIRNAVYEDQTSWAITLAELPQIDPTLFDQEAEKALEICTTVFQELLSEVQRGKSTITTANADFNLLVTDFRNFLLKWVELNAANYGTEANKQTNGHVDQNLATAKHSLQREHVIEAWKIKRQKKQGARITAQQHAFVQQTTQVSNALSPLFAQISSGMQCIILSPVSAPVTMSNTLASVSQNSLIASGKELGSLAATTQANSSPFAALSSQNHLKSLEKTHSSNEISKSISEKKQLLAHYQTLQHSLQPISVKNKYSGQTETIYAWFTDQSYKNSYSGFCYRESKNGPVLGPCDVSLEFDDLLMDFQVPGITSLSIQTKKTNGSGGFVFLENDQMLQIQKQIFELEMELLLLNQLKDALQNESTHPNSLSEKDSSRIAKIVDQVSKKLFKITLSDLVAGITNYSDEVTSLPKKCVEFLEKSGSNKIKAFHELLLILETEDISNILRVLHEPLILEDTQLNPNQEDSPQIAFNRAA